MLPDLFSVKKDMTERKGEAGCLLATQATL